MAHATIASLHVYPIKSCRGIDVARATIGPTGLEDDRRWMVVSEAGHYLTQRQLPRLALIAPGRDGPELTLAAPGIPALRLPAEGEGPRREVVIMDHPCPAIDAGPEAAEWLSQFLQHPVRLVRFGDAGGRSSDKKWAGVEVPITFPDAFPLLIISRASLDDLNGRLERPVPMSRFRPNLVLEGGEAYDEDRVRELVAGTVRLRMVWSCPRCKITTVDQATGEIPSPEPLITLRSYRRDNELPGVKFGQYAVIDSGIGERLSVGQRFAITLR
jgi:uncharacterized protein YcbX